jgi:hypothetical protein
MPRKGHPRPWRLACAINLVCAAFLLWDVPTTGRELLERLNYPYSAATVANLRGDIRDGLAHQFPGHSMFYHVGPGGATTSLDATTYGDLATLLAEEPGRTLWLELFFRETEHGLWAVTGHRGAYVIKTSYGHELTPEQVAEGRAVFARWLAAGGYIPAGEADALARGDVQRSGHRFAGYAHNAASLLALVGFVMTVRWVFDVRRAGRRRRLIERGRCPRCGYSVAGLKEGRCPECGGDVSEGLRDVDAAEGEGARVVGG